MIFQFNNVFFALVFSLVFQQVPSTANPKLPSVQLTIGKHSIVAEVTSTPAETARGLMFREKLGVDEGMLFVFPRDRRASFWMKNTSIPLSIAYIDRRGKILEIHDLEPFNEVSVRSQKSNVRYALEVNRGWFAAKNIRPGDGVKGLHQVPKK